MVVAGPGVGEKRKEIWGKGKMGIRFLWCFGGGRKDCPKMENIYYFLT